MILNDFFIISIRRNRFYCDMFICVHFLLLLLPTVSCSVSPWFVGCLSLNQPPLCLSFVPFLSSFLLLFRPCLFSHNPFPFTSFPSPLLVFSRWNSFPSRQQCLLLFCIQKQSCTKPEKIKFLLILSHYLYP